MNTEPHPERKTEQEEAEHRLVPVPPVTDLLLSVDPHDRLMLPDELRSDPEIHSATELRRKMLTTLSDIERAVPDVAMNISEAVERRQLQEETVAKFYDQMTDFLAADPNHARILLYIPFEYLPDRRRGLSSFPSLGQAQQRFLIAFYPAWRRLLLEHDLRANFVDGNILEPEFGKEMPAVSKAAHLIPALVERQLVSVSEVMDLLKNQSDAILRESVMDTLPVLADQHQISSNDWKRLLSSSDPALVRMAFRTSHSLEERRRLGHDETQRMFDLLRPETLAHASGNEMLAFIGDGLEALTQLIEHRHLSAANQQKAIEALLASLRFWPLNVEGTQMLLRLAEEGDVIKKIISSPESMRRACQTSAVVDWVKRWDQLFSSDAKAFSTEVMDIQHVWSRFETARQHHRRAIETKKPTTPLSFSQQCDRFKVEMRKLDERYHVKTTSLMTPGRVAWEKKEEQNRFLTKTAEEIAKELEEHRLEWTSVEEILGSKEDLEVLLAIQAIGRAMERRVPQERQDATKKAKEMLPVLFQVWQSGSVETQDLLIVVLSHWQALGILDETELHAFGVHLPKLDETQMLSPEEWDKLEQVVAVIKNDPELSQMALPVLLAFGSRLKGYAHLSADLDTALFIRPSVAWDRRTEFHAKLRPVLSGLDLGKVVEFWLETDGPALRVREVPLEDAAVAERDWVHLLVQSAWLGSPEQVADLQARLLPWYFKSSAIPSGDQRRRYWLHEMEREALQYRLMHKGYARFYPRRGGIATSHASLIDGESTFWDSGYRRLATKIFLKKVFLPSLSTKRKERSPEGDRSSV